MNQRLLRSVAYGTPAYHETLAALARRGESDLTRVEPAVREILSAVQREGDAAVARFVERFEHRRPGPLLVRDYGGAEALASLSSEVRNALELSAVRVRRYHEHQRDHLGNFAYEEEGVHLAARVTPLDRVGVYAPGGKAFYPSSVLMSAVPASVAGVKEIYVACPQVNAAVRAACHLAQVTGIVDAGGAQAIAALAYGTQSVPRVDKIVGPGNLYVTAAKRLVFGEVDIDGLAGPSEILVIADDSADPAHIAADLLSQAEHDEAAYPLLIASEQSIVDAVELELARQLAELPRKNIAEPSLRNNGMALVIRERAEMLRAANVLAVEHVAIQTHEPREVSRGVLRAGALFVGPMTPESAGDYVAGPSHVLPTGGAARFGAPVGVYDFVSRSSVIEYSPAALQRQAAAITAFARSEGLEAHARAVEIRTKNASQR
ncbi:MAG TPA: histidinol dehydrogenase [Polyangiaceae bacterium]|nr:histidinol dehydrogenase [Polyangiaceae bacterium]